MKTLASIALLSSLLAEAALAQMPARPIPYPLPQSNAWKRAIQNGTRTENGLPGPNYWTNWATYEIDAELVPEKALVSGHVKVRYENRSPRSLRQLQVHLRQNLHKAGVPRNVTVEITGGVKTSNLKIDGHPLGDRQVRTRGTVMTIRLPRSVGSGKSVELEMDWSYQVPKVGAPRNGHENFHVFWLAYWYPQIAVYDDVNGWVAEPYLGSAEFYMDYGDYKLSFTAPAGFVVRATGELSNPKEVLDPSAVKRLEQARKTHEIVHVITEKDLEKHRQTRRGKKKLTWRYEAKNVRDVAVSVSDRYVWDATHAVVKDRDGPGKDGICMIHALYETNSPAFKEAARYAQHTIEFMSAKVRPYPWPQMTACEGIIGGGMEFPMMTICGGRGRSVHGVVSHELIHMWFPMQTGSNEKDYAWQDEGLTSYFTNLCTADFRGKADGKKGETQPRRPRRRRGNAMRFLARAANEPIMRHGDHYQSRGAYSMLSYAKTSALLGQLRSLIGDEKFFEAFREYADAWAFKHPMPADFFATFNRVTEKNLDWYFRSWFYETWTLDQAIASVEEKNGKTQVLIEDKGLAPMPTEISVEYESGKKETQRIPVDYWLSGKKTKILLLDEGVKKLVIDRSQATLDVDRRNNSWMKKD